MPCLQRAAASGVQSCGRVSSSRQGLGAWEFPREQRWNPRQLCRPRRAAVRLRAHPLRPHPRSPRASCTPCFSLSAAEAASSSAASTARVSMPGCSSPCRVGCAMPAPPSASAGAPARGSDGHGEGGSFSSRLRDAPTEADNCSRRSARTLRRRARVRAGRGPRPASPNGSVVAAPVPGGVHNSFQHWPSALVITIIAALASSLADALAAARAAAGRRALLLQPHWALLACVQRSGEEKAAERHRCLAPRRARLQAPCCCLQVDRPGSALQKSLDAPNVPSAMLLPALLPVRLSVAGVRFWCCYCTRLHTESSRSASCRCAAASGAKRAQPAGGARPQVSKAAEVQQIYRPTALMHPCLYTETSNNRRR